MAKSNQRGRKNNNSEGRNQYSSEWMDTVRDKPMKSAAAAAAAVGAGVFLWSKRNEISDQIGRLSSQISDWAEDMRSNMSSNPDRELALTEGPNESSAIESSRATGSRSGRSTSSRSRTGSTARATGSQSSTGANMDAAGSGTGIAH